MDRLLSRRRTSATPALSHNQPREPSRERVTTRRRLATNRASHKRHEFQPQTLDCIPAALGNPRCAQRTLHNRMPSTLWPQVTRNNLQGKLRRMLKPSPCYTCPCLWLRPCSLRSDRAGRSSSSSYLFLNTRIGQRPPRTNVLCC